MSSLKPEIVVKIKSLILLYPAKQAVTLPALHLVQDLERCVSQQAIVEIAALLELSPAEIHDTMSFYGFFKTELNPLGKCRLWVCRSLACDLRGADDLLNKLITNLGVAPGQTTKDGMFTLEEAECIGACEGAPCVLINDVHCHNVSDADRLIDDIRKKL